MRAWLDGFLFNSSAETQQLGFRRIEHYFSDLNGLFPLELESVNFVTCPKQGLEMEAVFLHRSGLLEYFCPKQGQDFKPSVAPLYPNMGQVPPCPPPLGGQIKVNDIR